MLVYEFDSSYDCKFLVVYFSEIYYMKLSVVFEFANIKTSSETKIHDRADILVALVDNCLFLCVLAGSVDDGGDDGDDGDNGLTDVSARRVRRQNQQCGPVPRVNHATASSTKATHPVGTTVSYSCNGNYHFTTLTFVKRITCQSNGQWSPLNDQCVGE